jgi:hypothetical protein
MKYVLHCVLVFRFDFGPMSRLSNVEEKEVALGNNRVTRKTIFKSMPERNKLAIEMKIARAEAKTNVVECC